MDITLKHQFSGERRSVPVEHVAPTLTYVSIRWGQSGVYDLNLKLNKLTARSQKAQRKGKPHWEADDIEAVRAAAKAYLAQKRSVESNIEAIEVSIKRHIESMPNPRIGEHPTAQAVDDLLANYEPFPSYTGDPDESA